MKIGQEIIQFINEAKRTPAVVDEESNLCADLGFDSLFFVRFLLNIEENYSISFDIAEMEECLKVGRLIELVERKAKEQGGE